MVSKGGVVEISGTENFVQFVVDWVDDSVDDVCNLFKRRRLRQTIARLCQEHHPNLPPRKSMTTEDEIRIKRQVLAELKAEAGAAVEHFGDGNITGLVWRVTVNFLDKKIIDVDSEMLDLQRQRNR